MRMLTEQEHDELLSAVAERDRLLKLLNTPETLRFLEGTRLEVAHQVERWGTVHDRAKEPADWFWLARLPGRQGTARPPGWQQREGVAPLHQHRGRACELAHAYRPRHGGDGAIGQP